MEAISNFRVSPREASVSFLLVKNMQMYRAATAISGLSLRCSQGLTAVGIFAPGLLPRVWSLPALVLWAGLAEECLLPVLLSLCDKNFTTWVANIYTCRSRSAADLARQHQGTYFFPPKFTEMCC